ncbi:MAG: ATP-dependent RecD-like DNA helicase [Gemmatimonadaceae bacterium]|nr:ATP-dependent RecD-like DNA helicase [Gloeobacterales cyanobacterium ES-bin-141]
MDVTGNSDGRRLDILQGTVERVTYHNPQNGYTIARLSTPRAREPATIVGNFGLIQPGQGMRLEGTWSEHPQYGSQFQVETYRETKPATITGIEKYLGSGLIKGVGPVTAKRIVGHFGLETLEIIEQSIGRLIEVPGVGPKRVRDIQKAWVEQKAVKEVMVFLQAHQVSTVHAAKIFKTYGEQAIQVVTENPYRLAQDIYGIGFRTADTIAHNIGIDPESPYRLRAGLTHTLQSATEDGHCYLPLEELIQKAAEILKAADLPALVNQTEALVKENLLMSELTPDGYACFHPPLYHSEVGLAGRVRALLALPLMVDQKRVEDWLGRYTARHNLHLSAQQCEAVRLSARERVLILTGGPGTGKTTCARTIVALWKAMGKKILLASPTGRAAQRLSEVTGEEARTVHRLLEFDPASFGFKRGQDNPLPCDALLVDECSMLDLPLSYALIRAVAPSTQLLLVGDGDQLPAVGPGNILRDLMESARVPTVRLTEVFRQAQSSWIITNAHRINRGQMPQWPTESADCRFVEAPTPELVVYSIENLIAEQIPALGFSSRTDVQVLCPMNRGLVGANHLNTVLQQLLNPPEPQLQQIERAGRILREGDRVIQKTNDYQRLVFNGDLGTIRTINREDQQMLVRFGDRDVSYDFADLGELAPAFAISIHKAQGSEYPVIVIPVHTQHFPMLSRNLLYTGLTRARKLAILVGTQRAIALCVHRAELQGRYTRLRERLVSIG